MKRILFSCLSLAFVMMLWAFTQPRENTPSNPRVVPIWFYYDGSGDPFERESYTLDPPSTDCTGSSVLCAILAEPDGAEPSLPSSAGISAAAASSNNFADESALVDKKAP